MIFEQCRCVILGTTPHLRRQSEHLEEMRESQALETLEQLETVGGSQQALKRTASWSMTLHEVAKSFMKLRALRICKSKNGAR